MALADQLRAQWGGDWNIGGIDRAEELARLLAGQGITSLDGMRLAESSVDAPRWVNPSGLMNEQYQDGTERTTGRSLMFGDQVLNPNRSGEIYGLEATKQWISPNGEFIWSPEGHGAVGYSVQQDASGNPYIMPMWNSSSDADSARTVAKLGAAVFGGGSLLEGAMGSGLGSMSASAPITGSGVGAIAPASWETLAGVTLPGFSAPAIGAAAAGGAAGAASAGGAGAAAGSAGLLGSVKTAADALGGGKVIAPLVGAALGAGAGDATQTTQNQMDPRMQSLLYGDGGLLGQARDYFQANRAGNPLVNQAATMAQQAYSDPSFMQGINQMRGIGQGLLTQAQQPNEFMAAFKRGLLG